MTWKSSKFGFIFPSVSIGILLLYLAWHSEASKSTEYYDRITVESKNKAVKNLLCHVCHSEKDESCFNLTKYGDESKNFSQLCEPDKQICMVRKFSFTTSTSDGSGQMKTFALKRDCMKACEDGCVIMGERTRLYVCSQCCDSDLCNVGSGAGSIHNRKTYFRVPSTSARRHFFENTVGSSFLHFIQIFVSVMIIRFPL